MARKRTSPLEDTCSVAAAMPWWGGVAAGVVLYFVFSAFAGHADPKNPLSIVVSTFAGVLRYVVPVICFAGALASVLGRRHREQLLSRVAMSSSHRSLESMSWREFEMLVGEAYRARGFRVHETPPGADGGVDLELERDGERHLVQCKQWKAQTVGVSVVREMFGVMTAERAARCYVVTSGRFTAEAVSFARGKPIELLDGPALHSLIRGVDLPTANQSAEDALALACPSCGNKMVRRLARKGPNAGSEFWGCTRWPSCRGTRPI